MPDQVGYQVFPDRFARTETGAPLPAWAQPADWDDPVVHKGPEVPYQLYGGTLDGITAHLDHLVALGATMLYLTPVFEAWSNHRYDAVSFDRVDPLLGGDAALARLIDAVHARGLRLMGDLTTNHTGDHHDWFLEAQRDPDQRRARLLPVRHRRNARLRGRGSTSRRCRSSTTPSPSSPAACTTAPTRSSPRGCERGLDGWRIDVANMTGRLGADDLAHEVARALRRTMAQVRPDAWLLAEHGHDASLDLMGTAGTGRWTTPASPGRSGAGSTAARPAGRRACRHGLDYLGPAHRHPGAAGGGGGRDDARRARGDAVGVAGRAPPCTSTPTTRRGSAPSPAAASTAASTPTASAASGTSSASGCR